MMRRQIITPDDAHKFFGDCRAAISASADREGAWFDCAKETGRKVRAKEIGPAYAADQLREVIREQSLFADDREDDIQATIAATFEHTAEEPGLAVNGHEVIVEEPPPVTSSEDYGVRPTEHTEAETPPRFTPIAIDDIELAAEPAWLVYRLLPARGLACIVGPPKCGKSFMTTDMLFSVARGGPYAGRGTLPGPVIFLTGEGVTGFKRRLIAMRRHYGVEGRGLPFFMIENVPDLGSERTDVHGLLRELDKFIAGRGIERPRVLALDTLARCMGDGDENSARDMGRFVDRCGMIERHFECLVAVVHHMGKNPSAGGRGSNALNGAADVTLTVEKGGAYSTVRIDEMKDGPEGQEWRFRLVPFDLSEASETPIEALTEATTCVVELLTEPMQAKQIEAKSRKAIRGVNGDLLKVIRRAIDETGTRNVASELVPSNVTAIDRPILKHYCRMMAWQDQEAEPDSFRSVLNRSLKVLRACDAIGFTQDWIWLT